MSGCTAMPWWCIAVAVEASAVAVSVAIGGVVVTIDDVAAIEQLTSR